jgi:hypothetical protein
MGSEKVTVKLYEVWFETVPWSLVTEATAGMAANRRITNPPVELSPAGLGIVFAAT